MEGGLQMASDLKYLAKNLLKKEKKLIFFGLLNSIIEFLSVGILAFLINTKIMKTEVLTDFDIQNFNLLLFYFPVAYLIYGFVQKQIFFETQKVGTRYADKLFFNIANLNNMEADAIGVSNFQKQIITDTDRFTNGLILPLFTILQKFTTVMMLTLSLFFVIDMLIIAVLMVLFLLILVCYIFTKNRNVKIGSKLNKILTDRYEIVTKRINYDAEAKSLREAQFLDKSFFRNSEDLAVLQGLSIFNSQLVRFVVEATIFTCICFIVVFFDKLNDYSFDLAALSLVSLRVLPNVQQIFSSLVFMQSHRVVIEGKKNLLIDFFGKEGVTFRPSSKDDLKVSKIEIDELEIKLSDEKKIYYPQMSFTEGKIYGITGPSGKGKTSLLNVICGLNDSYGGSIKFFDKNKNLIVQKAVIHYLSQNVLTAKGSLYSNVNLFQSKGNIDNLQDLNLKYDNLFEQDNGLLRDDGKQTKVENLSGGQKQRIGIFRLLILDKKLRVLDEQTSSLDRLNVEKVCKLLVKTKKEKITIIVSHDSAVLKMCDELIKL